MNRRNLCATIGICAVAGCLRQQEQATPDNETQSSATESEATTDTTTDENSETNTNDSSSDEFPIQLETSWSLPTDIRNVTRGAGDIFIQTHSTTFDRYTAAGDHVFTFDELADGYRADITEGARSEFFVDESGVYLGVRQSDLEAGGSLYAIEPTTGAVRWEVPVEYGGVDAITRGGDLLVYAGVDQESNTSFIESLDTESGDKQWELTGLDGPVPQLLTFDGNLIIQRTAGIEAIDLATQDSVFTENVIPGSQPAGLYNGSLYFQFDGDERLRSLALPSGDERWTVEITDSPNTPPSFGTQGVFYGGMAGHVLAHDLETGEQLWTQRVDGEIEHPLVVADGVVWLTSERGTLFGLDESTGERLYEEQFDEEFSFTVVGDQLVLPLRDSALTIQKE